MILSFPEVVTEAEHREILGLVAAAEFVDGRETASPLLASTKENQQIRRDTAQVLAITEILLRALRRHAGFCSTGRMSIARSWEITRCGAPTCR